MHFINSVKYVRETKIGSYFIKYVHERHEMEKVKTTN